MTDLKLDEVLAWFCKPWGSRMAALYSAAGPDWLAKVIESGSRRWKPPFLADEERDTQPPTFVEVD